MWNSDLHYNLIQKGAGNYEVNEESEESEVSTQETEFSQEETESLEPWSRIFDEAEKRHETQLNALISEYEGNADSENVARVKAENALLPVYRKALRKVLLEYLQWMRAMKKDSTFKYIYVYSFVFSHRTVNSFFNMVYTRVCRNCPISWCGTKYLVRLANHLADVHQLDHIQRRQYLQEAKLQPKVKVVV